MPLDRSTKDFPIAALLVPSLILGLVLASSGFDLLPELGVFNAKRVLEPLVFGASLLIVLFNHELRSAYAHQWARVPGAAGLAIAVVFMLGTVSVLRFSNPGYGLAEIALLALIAMLIPLVAACRVVAGVHFDRWVLSLVAAMGLIVVFTETIGVLTGWSLGSEFGFDQMLVRFAHPRFYNQLQSWSLPVLAAIPLVFGKTRKWMLVSAVLIGLQWTILLMSGGRGSFLALLISLVAILSWARPLQAIAIRMHLLGAAIAAVLFVGLLASHTHLAPEGGNFVEKSVGRSITNSTGRTLMWRLAVEDSLANPWLGAGPMRFNCDGPAIWPAHPHSFPMQLVSEWGIPAVLLVVCLVGWMAWRLAQQLHRHSGEDRYQQALRALLAAGVLAASLHACLSGVLIMPASQMMAVIICGWLLGMIPPGPTGRQSVLRRLAPGLALAGLIFCISLTQFNISELRQYQTRTELLAKAGPVQPRYWQHGRACQYRWPEQD